MSMPAEITSDEPTLAELLQGIAVAPPVAVAGIETDSRRVNAGDVFLACHGQQSHGLDYVEQALARKAAAVVWDPAGGRSFESHADVISVAVSGLGTYLGTIANRWFASPSHSVRVSGVTGTNGKTTVAYLIAQCLQMLGRPCAYQGTLGSGIGELTEGGGLTTPDCIEIHRRLAGFRDSGARYAAIEVSSHGLTQGRVDGVRFDAAIFTNLSRDHIDYHGNMDAYGATKARLFVEHEPALRIIGIDSTYGRKLAQQFDNDTIVVASNFDNDAGGQRFLFAAQEQASSNGSLLEIRSSWGNGRCALPLPGAFNIANAAEVLALLLSYDVAFADAILLMSSVSAPPGRLQRVPGDPGTKGPHVFVDYAHTPGALQAVLAALRPHCEGELWCVFGCGGDRDRGKRPLMGEVVEQLADVPLITNDNPRSEMPADIIRDVRAGMARDCIVIEDRAAAIAHAIAAAAADDIVLIAGKGHEDYQIIGERRLEFSDFKVALANLRARDKRGSGQ
jgi:UDP-N-acetylmuramoyl-L-alanyl-D-glutamate--2,6-diaminopimelate ligase